MPRGVGLGVYLKVRPPVLGKWEVAGGQRWYHSLSVPLVVSYTLSTVTVALSLTIRPQFAIECLRRSNQQGMVTLGAKFGAEGLTDVSQSAFEMFYS